MRPADQHPSLSASAGWLCIPIANAAAATCRPPRPMLGSARSSAPSAPTAPRRWAAAAPTAAVSWWPVRAGRRPNWRAFRRPRSGCSSRTAALRPPEHRLSVGLSVGRAGASHRPLAAWSPVPTRPLTSPAKVSSKGLRQRLATKTSDKGKPRCDPPGVRGKPCPAAPRGTRALRPWCGRCQAWPSCSPPPARHRIPAAAVPRRPPSWPKRQKRQKQKKARLPTLAPRHLVRPACPQP